MNNWKSRDDVVYLPFSLADVHEPCTQGRYTVFLFKETAADLGRDVAIAVYQPLEGK